MLVHLIGIVTKFGYVFLISAALEVKLEAHKRG